MKVLARAGVDQPSPGMTARGRSPAPRQARCPEPENASSGSFSEEPTWGGPDPAASPLEVALGREAVGRYEAALARLRPRDREAVRARLERQRSYEELAEALGVGTVAAARVVVTRALGRLVEAMSE